MTNPCCNAQAVLPFLCLSFYNALVSTPLNGVTKLEILNNLSTSKVLSRTSLLKLYRGLEPNILKSLSKIALQTSSVKLSSSIIPSQLDPVVRGTIIGCASAGIEATVNNAWSVLETRFIQGQKWKIIKQEGPSVLTRGLSSAFMHRILSGTVFWGSYEKLHQCVPENPSLAGMGAGMIQVCATAPFYISKTLRQGRSPPAEPLWLLFKTKIKKQGLIQGLFLPGLIPRLAQSILIGGPLMTLLEKKQIIYR
jgi:hypothetical protein